MAFYKNTSNPNADPDPNPSPSPQPLTPLTQVAFYMDTFVSAGIPASVGYELGTPER